MDVDFHEALYRGQEVDVTTTPGLDWYADRLARRSEDYRKLHERGLSHFMIKAMGHVVRDGVPVGLMTEAAVGRYVRYRDRAEVYNAVALAQSKGVILRRT